MLKIISNDPNRSDNVKCGEIFWHADTAYKATCFFCGEHLLFDDFPKHFQEHHIDSNRIFTETLKDLNAIKLNEVEDENIRDKSTELLCEKSTPENDEVNFESSTNAIQNSTTKKTKKQKNDNSYTPDYPCKLCSRVYKRIACLNQHILSTHSGHKEFLNNDTPDMIDLPFQCLLCPRAYSHKKNLLTHVQMNHPPQSLLSSNSQNSQEDHISKETDIFVQALQEINTVNEVKIENTKFESTDDLCGKSTENAVEEIEDEKLINIEDLQSSQGAILKTSVLEGAVLNDHKEFIPEDKEDEKPNLDVSEESSDWKCDDDDNDDWSDHSSLPPLKKKKTKQSDTIGKDIGDYPCKLCPRTYKRLIYLNQHIRVNHTEGKELKNDDKPNIEVDNLPFQCAQCPRSYRHKKSLLGHIRIHHTSKLVKELHKCEECGEVFREKRYLDTHLFKHKGLTCEVCGRKFTQVGNLQLHLKRHTGVKEFKCEECGKMFFTEHERNNHMVMHTQHFPSICEICGKPCRDGKLKSHMRRHTGERPAKCEVCGKCFFDTHDLNVHATSHSDERPFPCDICGSAFRHKKALRVHKKIHNKDRKHICKICGKSYAQAGGLTAHMRTHNTAIKDDITTVLDEIEML
ncbi:zinc finger protein 595-like [Teleopsis dalmanni]|uniref:zinc finger protein 595-like n=1 Tax=Teleopsis dalmanni TaxID=139649 RepID=UPI0018CE2980|nr:zinc finger protein 595-like [Teleopsis dalmanni]